MWVGDTVTARVEVTGIREVPARRGNDKGKDTGARHTPRLKQQLVTCSTVITRTATTHGPSGSVGDVCLDGVATVLLPPPQAPLS